MAACEKNARMGETGAKSEIPSWFLLNRLCFPFIAACLRGCPVRALDQPFPAPDGGHYDFIIRPITSIGKPHPRSL